MRSKDEQAATRNGRAATYLIIRYPIVLCGNIIPSYYTRTGHYTSFPPFIKRKKTGTTGKMECVPRVEDMVRELGEAKGCLENWVLLGKGLNQAGVFDLDDLRDQDLCDGEVFDGVVSENNLGPGYRKLFEKKIGFKFDDRIAEDGAHAHKALKAAKKQVKRPGPCRACTLGCLASFFFSFFHKVEGVCSHWCVLA